MSQLSTLNTILNEYWDEQEVQRNPPHPHFLNLRFSMTLHLSTRTLSMKTYHWKIMLIVLIFSPIPLVICILLPNFAQMEQLSQRKGKFKA